MNKYITRVADRFPFLKRKWVLAVGAVLIGLAIFFLTTLGGTNEGSRQTVVVGKESLTEEVNVTGRVRPAEDVDLAFERGGKVSRVYKTTGSRVRAGETIITLENADLVAEISRSRANLDAEDARLAELASGSRPEDIYAAEVRLANAERSLADALSGLENARAEADSDLHAAYESGVQEAKSSVQEAKSALVVLTDIQYMYANSNSDQNDIRIAETKAKVIEELFGISGAGRWSTAAIAGLSGGLYGTVLGMNADSSTAVDQALANVLRALERTIETLNAIDVSELSAADKTSMASQKSSINAAIAAISAKQQAIVQQKAAGTSAVLSAESAITSAKNAKALAESDLALKRAGTASQQVDAQRARVAAARASLQSAQAQLSKTILTSPIAGTLSRQDGKRGEIVNGNTSIAAVISNASFEIEARIPEADIAKVKIGNSARVGVDAYPGEDFEAKLVSIDPAETITEGVATYKVVLRFVKEDPRIRSGMTADIDITTAQREAVVAVPQRAVVTKNDKKYVRVISDEKVVDREVQTGIRSIDGMVEIITGLSGGESIVVSKAEE